MSTFNETLNAMNGDSRTIPLYRFFGWQGGTVHQLAAATGLSVMDILYSPIGEGKDTLGGFSAIRTCGRDWRRDVLAPKHKGDLPYWHGVIAGFYATPWVERA